MNHQAYTAGVMQAWRDAGLQKEAIMTGLPGYLTANPFAPLRASELKGAYKARGEDPESMFINHPWLSHLVVPAIGAGVGAVAGAPIGGALGDDAGAIAGMGLGAQAGGTLGSLISLLLQQQAVNQGVRRVRRADPVVGRRLRKSWWKPDNEEDV